LKKNYRSLESVFLYVPLAVVVLYR
jgi:hypothetical protein